MAVLLQPASRESLAAAEARLDQVVDGASAADLERLGDDLFQVLRLLIAQTALRRSLADPAVPEASRSGLADRLLDGKISSAALDVVSELVSARWSRSADLLEALETLARRATLGVAEKQGPLDRLGALARKATPGVEEKAGGLDEVEDELFRFGRILDREPQLNALLSDNGADEDERVGLLREVLGNKVSPVTEALLVQTVRTPRGRSLDLAAEELSELASARQDRYVAHVRSAVRLTPDQEQRLGDSLSRIYSRAISLQVELDPDLLGGLVVRVGGELIDGSVAGKLAAARRQLPS